MFAPAAIIRWITTSWASTDTPPDASVTTVHSHPLPSAWIDDPDLRPEFGDDQPFTACGLGRVHDFQAFPDVNGRQVDHLLIRKNVRDLGNQETVRFAITLVRIVGTPNA
ncbi:hypothetical protein [uncultured Jannaschia sp.]|uniref:hypothetical protein n=1 Tax=uncultured Jannaschia sp. TaxID=293347 RepID=UPI002603467C|nr:hypothetical protein [uncultured Jannaschia sp.]